MEFSEASELAAIDALATAPYQTFALWAAVELDVFTHLADPKTPAELAAGLAVPADRLRLLMWSLLKSGLVRYDEPADQFHNSRAAQKYLNRGSESFIEQRLSMYRTQLDAVAETAGSLSSAVPRREKDFDSMSDADLAEYYLGTHPSTVACGRKLLDILDMSDVDSVLDAGCGTGGLALTMVQALPGVRATAVDLPRIAKLVTGQLIPDVALHGRIEVHAANLVTDPLPGGHDLAVCRACLQTMGPADLAKAIGNIATAVRPGGRFAIVGAVLDDTRTGPPRAVNYNLLAINYYRAGAAYTVNEYRGALEAAGFQLNRIDMVGDDRLLVSTRV